MEKTGMATEDDSERRIAPRTRTLKRGRIVFNNRFSTIDCIVRNISHTGALLTVETSVQLPKQFEIAIGDQALRPARLVYRRETFAGIHFLDVDAEEALPDPAERWEGGAQDEFADEATGIARIESARLPAALLDRLPWAPFA